VKVLNKSFFERDTAEVAKDLIGKILVRRFGKKLASGRIVETEAYYGEKDPASRAHGRKKFRAKWKECGKTFIYMVHGNWLLNITAHEKGKVGAVLIRALEPLKGIELMRKNRGTSEILDLTNGPGKLTQALRIDKSLNEKSVTSKQSEIFIADGIKLKISSSHRIGVKKDLRRKLRFFAVDNPFVSRKS